MARDIVVFNIAVVVDNFFDFLLFPQNCSFEWRTKNDQEVTMLPDALVKIYPNSKGVIHFPLFNYNKMKQIKQKDLFQMKVFLKTINWTCFKYLIYVLSLNILYKPVLR